MAVENLKSAPITNLDASPIITNTIGEGAPGMLRSSGGHVLATAATSATSTYRLARIPTTAKVKHVFLSVINAPGAGATDIDVAFSDSTNDGTQQSLAGGIVQITGPVDNKLFGAAFTVPATKTITDVTLANTFTADHQNLPLWQVLVNLGATQFTADPGGFFDILLKITTAITNSVDLGIEVQYVE